MMERNALISTKSLREAHPGDGSCRSQRTGAFHRVSPRASRPRRAKGERSPGSTSTPWSTARRRTAASHRTTRTSRDCGIVANIVEVMQQHPGKRLAVVIGAHDKHLAGNCLQSTLLVRPPISPDAPWRPGAALCKVVRMKGQDAFSPRDRSAGSSPARAKSRSSQGSRVADRRGTGGRAPLAPITGQGRSPAMAGRAASDNAACFHAGTAASQGKQLGRDDFSKIPNGAPGIEHRMSLTFDGGVVVGQDLR